MKKEMVLIVTGSDECTASRVIENLKKIDQPFYRLDTDLVFLQKTEICMELSNDNSISILNILTNNKIDFSSIKSVWFRRTKHVKIKGCATELERQFIDDEITSAFWSLYTSLENVYWMNYPVTSRYLLEHNKFLQMKYAIKAGLMVPDTLITNQPEKLIAFCDEHGGTIAVKAIRSRMFVKPDGNAEAIYTKKVSSTFLKQHSAEISQAPIMAQEYIEKKLEFRITIVGAEIFACAIHSQDSERTKEDWRRYDFDKVKHEEYDLPQGIKDKLLIFMKLCGLSFGAIDMILKPNGDYIFLEINPSGQFTWIENLTNMPISKAIAETLINPPFGK